MSLLGAALGGLGGAAQNITNDYITADLKDDLASKESARSLSNASTLQSQQAAIAKDRDAFASQLATQQYGAKKNIDNDPTNIAADATREGAMTAAKDRNTSREVSPGNILLRDGQEVGANDNPTSAEINASLYRDGMKGQADAGARADRKAAADSAKQRNDEFYNITKPANFTDPATGQVNSTKWQAITTLGKKQLDSDSRIAPTQAVSDASALYDKAQDFAKTTIESNAGFFTKDKTKATDSDALAKKVLNNIMSGMDAKKAFDPTTYNGDSKDSSAPAPSGSPAPAPSGVRIPSIAPSPASARTAATSDDRIPDPPPEKIQQGLSMVTNPAFLDWQTQYGDRYNSNQSLLDARRQDDALAAKRSFNPYAQNRVR